MERRKWLLADVMLIECRKCVSTYCDGCNLLILANMLHEGKFDNLMNNHTIKVPVAKIREDIPAEWVERNIYTSAGNVDMLQSARCSKCGKYHTTPYAYYFDHYNFCPNCGARMTSQREDGNGT